MDNLLLRRGRMMTGVDGIQFLEWISGNTESTAYNSVIDTGLFWQTEADKIECKAAFLHISSNRSFYGNGNLGSQTPLFCGGSANGMYSFGDGTGRTDTNIDIEIDVPIVVTQDLSHGYIAGTKYNANSNYLRTTHVFLFSYSLNTSEAVKMYYCKMWHGDTLVRDFIPCINVDGEIGMFDNVTQSFFGNARTGNIKPFIAGPRI